MKKLRRWGVVIAACLIALGVVLGHERQAADTGGTPPAVVLAKAGADAAPETRAAAAPATSDVPDPSARMSASVANELFAAKSWFVPPPPPPPPKPVAPPFPYVFAGSMRDGDKVILFLSQGDRNFIVRKGESFGGNYRVDDIGESEAEFTYLPLMEKQSMPIGNEQ